MDIDEIETGEGMFIPNNVISNIGTLLTVDELRTVRLINKQWAVETGKEWLSVDMNISSKRLALIKENGANYINWLFGFIDDKLPNIRHLRVVFSTPGSVMQEEHLRHFFHQLLRFSKKSKQHSLTMAMHATSTIHFLHVMNIFAEVFKVAPEYSIVPVELQLSFLEGEMIEDEAAEKINALYEKIQRFCVLTHTTLYLSYHYGFLHTDMCTSVRDAITIYTDYWLTDILTIDLSLFKNCDKITLDIRSFCYQVEGIHYVTDFHCSIPYLNHIMLQQLFGVSSKVRFLSFLSLPSKNDWCSEFVGKLIEYVKQHKYEVSFEICTINDIRVAHLVSKVLPYIGTIYLSCTSHADWIAAHIIYYFMRCNDAIVIEWKNDIDNCIPIKSLRDCKKLARLHKEVYQIWQFILWPGEALEHEFE
jgi:hypothetical protein